MGSLRKTNRVLYIIVLLLAAALVYMFIRSQKAVNERNESFTRGVELKGELDKVMDEYTTIKMENQDLSAQMSEKDSIIMANRAEIEKLIATQADYNKIRRKLELLRKITQDYVARIDSLVVVNRELAEENTQLAETVTQVKAQNNRLEADKAQLQEKITVASALKAYDLQATTVRMRADGKEKPTDRAARVTRINLQFTIGENKVVEPGLKTVYARISRPDGEVMALGTEDNYSFELNGKTLQYTLKQEIDYRNEAVPVKMFWDRKDVSAPAMAGTYEIMLYAEGVEIGRGSFMIRE
ncbi:MAG: hypothetical protein J1F29_03880 [Lentimicrobiaceae bacterium]|nr:hypothetical protein [Lentimicrobiaceae bacterium]